MGCNICRGDLLPAGHCGECGAIQLTRRYPFCCKATIHKLAKAIQRASAEETCIFTDMHTEIEEVEARLWTLLIDPP
jgi:hypothetical protein